MKRLFVTTAFFVMTFSLAAFDVVRDGQPKASISLPENLPKKVTTAIDQFQSDLENLTGTPLPVNDESLNRMEVVFTPTTIDKDDVVQVTFPEKNVMRISGGTHGLVRIFPSLLEKFAGVRYVYPTDLGTHYPQTKNFVIPEKPFTQKPFFVFTRFLWNPYSPWLDRLGAKWALDCMHNIPTYVIPVKKYIETGNWPDPKVFAMIDGKRFNMKEEYGKLHKTFMADWQPCHTSGESIDEAVKNIEEFLEDHPETTSISLAPNDHRGYCECEECAELNKKGAAAFRMFGPAYRYQNRSESYYHWCNEIVKRVVEKHPNMFFAALAYRETHFAPHFKLHPNIVVYLCFDFGCSQYPRILEKQKKWLDEWKRTGAKLGVWEYGFGDSGYTLPRVGFKNQGRMFELLADHGFRAFFGEGAESVGEGPKRYLYMKLMESPRADVNAIVNDWCAACVGEKAAPFLEEYFEFWERFWPERASQTAFAESSSSIYLSWTPFGPYMYALRKGDMAMLRNLMEKMVTVANESGDARQKKRARWLMTAFDYYEACAETSSAEILSDSGAIETVGQALEFLRHLPAAVAANEKRLKLMEKITNDPELKWWNGLKKIQGKTKSTKQYERDLAKVSNFASDPQVRKELEKIATDEHYSRTTRCLAKTMLRLKDDKSKNLLPSIPEFAHLAGKIHTLTLPVPNGEWSHDIPMKPGEYLVKVNVTIPKDAVIEDDTWMNLRLQGRSQYHKAAGGIIDTPRIKPEPGKSYVIANIVKISDRATFLQLIVNLFNFEDGAKVNVSDVSISRFE